ncbi:Uncharacterised protein [Chlamydia trachomatis]|nr:Uncharacterised protein [Chlamydia trachomatis]
MNRKLLVLMSSLLVATAGGATYFGIIKPTSTRNSVTQKQETVESNDIKIAFVNEDTGVNYN